ncbi:MAG TPA: hypothetical protein PKB03_00260 [Baekduia sp.]|nr:hypothetical protein [Baekduia sp.]
MTEQDANEVARVLLCINDARSRAARAATGVASQADDAQAIAAALAEAEQGLAEVHRLLKQRTYYASPDASMTLSL